MSVLQRRLRFLKSVYREKTVVEVRWNERVFEVGKEVGDVVTRSKVKLCGQSIKEPEQGYKHNTLRDDENNIYLHLNQA